MARKGYKIYRLPKAEDVRCVSCVRCEHEGEGPASRYYCSMRPSNHSHNGMTQVFAYENYCESYIGKKK